MGQPQKRKKQTGGDKTHRRAQKNKHFYKDIDQIHVDLKPENAPKLVVQPLDEDLPGQGQFYCLECAKYFINDPALKAHKKDKPHKQRLKALKDAPYSIEEAERCAGLVKEVRKKNTDTEMK